MDCARIADDRIMERYLLRDLADAEREALEQHFFECDDCFTQIEALEAAQYILAADPSSRPPRQQNRTRTLTLAVAAVALIGLVAVLWWVLQPPPPRTASLSLELAELARIEAPHYEPVRLRGATDEAQQRFRSAMELYSAGDYLSAIPGLEEAAELDLTAPNISFYLGACYLLTGRNSDGVATLQHTVNLGDTPYLEEALILVAKARLVNGDVAGAERAFEEAAGLGGDFESEARDALTNLREVSGAQ